MDRTTDKTRSTTELQRTTELQDDDDYYNKKTMLSSCSMFTKKKDNIQGKPKSKHSSTFTPCCFGFLGSESSSRKNSSHEAYQAEAWHKVFEDTLPKYASSTAKWLDQFLE